MTQNVSLVSEQYNCSNTTAALSKYALFKDKLIKKYGSDYEKKDDSHRITWVIPGGVIALAIYRDVEVSISYSDNKSSQKSFQELREYVQQKK